MIETANLVQALRRVAESSRHGLLWWADELWHLLPPSVRKALQADPIAVEIVLSPRPGAQTVVVQASRGGRSAQSIEMEDWRVALAWVAERRRRWGPLMRVDLVLPAGACLIREREVPATARNRIGAILALELERTTPFNAKDVRHGWRALRAAPGAASLLLEHVVAKRYLSDSVLAEAIALRVPIAAVDVIDAVGSRLGINLLEPTEVVRSLTGHLTRAIAVVAALLVIIATAAGVIAMQRQEDALVRLESDIGIARKEAQAARKKLQEADNAFERMGQLRLRRAQDTRVIAVWEEVTRRLPNTAWLTDVRIENSVLWLDGYARSASELVGILAQSSMFSGVALSAPVTRDAAKADERFQLRMKVEKIGAQPNGG